MVLMRKENYPKPDDGTYIAEVAGIEEFTSEKHPEYGTSLKFTFKIQEEPYVGTLVSGLAPAVWRPGNKLDKWFTGLGIESADIGTDIDADMLKGRQAKILVETDEKSGYTNVKNVYLLKKTENVVVAPAKPASAAITPVPAPLKTERPVVRPSTREIPF